MRTGRLWILTASRREKLIGYCIFTEVPSTQGCRSICLVDYQSIDEELDLLSGFIKIALRRAKAEGFYRLRARRISFAQVSRVRRARFLQESGWGTWTFLFRAADSKLDAELHQPQIPGPIGL